MSWLGTRFRGMKPTRALIAFGFLAAVIVVAATGLILWNLHSRELARAEREISNLCELLTEQTERALQSVDLVLRGTRDRLREGRTSGYLVEPKALHTLLRARIAGMPQISTLLLVDAGGDLVATSQQFPTPRLSLADRGYFTAHREDPAWGVYVGQPVRSRVDGQWTFMMSARLSDGEGVFAGVIAAGVDLSYFEQLYKAINLGPGGQISLYLRDGTLLASYPRREESIGKSFMDSAVFQAMLAKTDPGVYHGRIRSDEGGQPRIVSYGELRGLPLVITTAAAERAVLAGWRHQALLVSSGAAGVIVILMLAALALGRELKRDEALTAALRDSEARLNGIIGSAMDAIITVDEDQRIILFNPAAEQMFRCSAAQALGSPLERFLPERCRATHRELVRRYGETGITSRGLGGHPDISGRRADGEEFPADISISQLGSNGHKLYTAIVRDITARRRAEEELHKSHRQLRELSASLQAVREEERARIARELHDELGQHLTGLKMDLSWMGARLREDQAALAGKINAMKALIDSTVASMRRIASELRPTVLDDLGLAPAVEWLANDFAKRSGIRVVMDMDDVCAGLDNAVATSVFRIIQESLTNVARHSGASTVNLSLRQAEGRLIVEVRDDGRGMPADAGEKTRSFGLIGMRERAYMLGGQLNVLSQPGEGTTIQAVIPLPGPVIQESQS
jgi:PAS domain S-box-containing protein